MENSYSINASQENMLDDVMGIHLVRANAGKRFLNHLIDLFAFGFLLGVVAVIVPSLAAVVFFPFMPYIAFAVFIGIMESTMKGKTLGKLVTGTRAVRIDGTPISASTAFQRGFSRIVPFEAFSALGQDTNPWHDRWTGTYVIVEKGSRLA